MIRIGTRDSKLALWQANAVSDMLMRRGIVSELVPMKSSGDLDQTSPVSDIGVVGVFTKVLDSALLIGDIDIAVHSLKDYPTMPDAGIALAAVLRRHDPSDVLVYKCDPNELNSKELVIATGSVRRNAFWKNKFPHHQVVNLRGNVPTRLQKLEHSDWAGAIFAKAGLDRLQLLPENYLKLDWMTPAPAQGIIGIVCRSDDNTTQSALSSISDDATWTQAQLERSFLHHLEGGCSAPIGALATWVGSDEIRFTGSLLSPDGSQHHKIIECVSPMDPWDCGLVLAESILSDGARATMDSLRRLPQNRPDQ